MLYRLFSLQTNLHISLHHQSDILWHNGTNYKELLFSSDIWAGYILVQMSSWHDVVLLFAFLMCNLFCNNKISELQQKPEQQQHKYSVIYHWTEHVCRFIFLSLFLLHFLYHFFATTQLHSNNINKNKNKINLHELLNFQ